MNIVGTIPCTDVKDGRVVKRINFGNFRDARDPVEPAEAYCCEDADELVSLDIGATVESGGTRLEWVNRVANDVAIPSAVGDGIRTTDDMKALFDIGLDKVSVNTAAVENPEPARETSNEYGKQRLVVAVDGRKNPAGGDHPRAKRYLRDKGIPPRIQGR
jgi:cyclase